MSDNLFASLDWLTLSCNPDVVLTVQKVVRVYPLRLRLAASYDVGSTDWSTKATLKEQILNGSIRYLHTPSQAIEYRKHFSLLGIACATLWSRWELSEAARGGRGGSLWRPRVGCGLVLGDSAGCGWGGGGLLGHVGALPSLLLRPLSYSFKSSLPVGPNLRLKAYCESTLRLPRRLSLWVDAHGPGGDAFDDTHEPDGGRTGAGASLLLTLRKTAVVLDL